MTQLRIAIIQSAVSADKQRNLAGIETALQNLAAQKPDLVLLPEMFCCPYQASLFPAYAEAEGGDTWRRLAAMAAGHRIYLAAGTVPEIDQGRVYNTAYIFNRQGQMIGKHRKMHLFDINISCGQYFRESDTLTPGDEATVFTTEFGRIGLCICYDLRFPELARRMVDLGAQVILVPGAFNMTTGPAHWELLFRARALDNQVFMAGAAPARDMAASYHSWGHSLLVDPWGTVLQQLDEKSGYLCGELDLGQVDRVRAELPVLAHRRQDLYTLAWKD